MVGLTPMDVQVVRTAGKLTFKPLSGGQFRCLQLQRFGRLTAADKESIRNQVGPLTPGLKSSAQPEFVSPLFLRTIPWTCLECGRKNHNFHGDNTVSTCACGKKWLLKLVAGAQPVLPIATRIGEFWSDTYRCPHCSHDNYGLVRNHSHDCDYCRLKFMVPK